nr:DUF4192 domain-containing protein [Corynebacterium sp. sy017]
MKQLLADIPGHFGYYPEESVVFLSFRHVKNNATVTHTDSENTWSICSDNIEPGPIIRLSLADLDYAHDVGVAVRSIGANIVLAVIITRENVDKLDELHAKLMHIANDAVSEIVGCWWVPEIKTEAEYQLLFADENFFPDMEKNSQWYQGKVAFISCSPVMQAIMRKGELPDLTREEAMDYFSHRYSAFSADKREQLNKIAVSNGMNLQIQMFSENISVSELLTEFEKELLCTDDRTAYNSELLVFFAAHFATSFVRDRIILALLNQPQAAKIILLAVARSFSGEIRANALTLFAILVFIYGPHFRGVIALQQAQLAVPGHILSKLILKGYQRGMTKELLGAICRGARESIEDTWPVRD